MASLKKKLRKVVKKGGRIIGKVAPVVLPVGGGLIAGPLGAAAGGVAGAAFGRLGAHESKVFKSRLKTAGIATGASFLGSGLGNVAGGANFFSTAGPLRNLFGITGGAQGSSPNRLSLTQADIDSSSGAGGIAGITGQTILPGESGGIPTTGLAGISSALNSLIGGGSVQKLPGGAEIVIPTITIPGGGGGTEVVDDGGGGKVTEGGFFGGEGGGLLAAAAVLGVVLLAS